jgi:hypothetical protein
MLETYLISFACKTNSIHFNYYVDDLSIIQTDRGKDPQVMLTNKLHIYHAAYL